LKGYPPHERTTPLMSLLSRWRYRIVGQVGAPTKDRRIQPVAGISPSDLLLHVPPGCGYTRDQIYSLGFSYLDYPLDVPIPHSYTSNSFPEDIRSLKQPSENKDHMYDFISLNMLGSFEDNSGCVISKMVT